MVMTGVKLMQVILYTNHKFLCSVLGLCDVLTDMERFLGKRDITDVKGQEVQLKEPNGEQREKESISIKL